MSEKVLVDIATRDGSPLLHAMANQTDVHVRGHGEAAALDRSGVVTEQSLSANGLGMSIALYTGGLEHELSIRVWVDSPDASRATGELQSLEAVESNAQRLAQEFERRRREWVDAGCPAPLHWIEEGE